MKSNVIFCFNTKLGVRAQPYVFSLLNQTFSRLQELYKVKTLFTKNKRRERERQRKVYQSMSPFQQQKNLKTKIFVVRSVNTREDNF